MGVVTPDAHGNPMAGPPEAVVRYDHALDLMLRLRDEVVPAALSLVGDEPDVPMAQALWAYLLLSSTDAADVASARRAVDALGSLARHWGPRGAHHRALDAWAAGDWPAAAAVLDDLLVEWPTDLLALMFGHQLDFFVGDAGNLRDRVGRSLDAVDPEHPHRGLVEGMYAFGLEESGHYERAEDYGLAAVARNPDDVWAIHAVAHAYEMRGRVDDGLAFLDERAADWQDGNLFVVHLAWHRALFLLEAGRVDEVLATYDLWAYSAEATAAPLQLIDASALLWRLLLDGVDVGDRFAHLADAWAAALDRCGGPGAAAASWYPFNDAHAVMAFAGAGRLAEARAVVARLEGDVAAARADGGVSHGAGPRRRRRCRRRCLAGDHGRRCRASRRPGDARVLRGAPRGRRRRPARRPPDAPPLRRLARAARRVRAHAARLVPGVGTDRPGPRPAQRAVGGPADQRLRPEPPRRPRQSGMIGSGMVGSQ